MTIARAVTDLLPQESLIYFGDTAHLPYGDKSPQILESYVVRIADFLLSCGVKLILVACNSAAVVYEKLQQYLGDRVLLVNVVDPMVKVLAAKYHDSSIGLIGTKLTVASKIYGHRIRCHGVAVEIKSLATPLLVPIIEEGFSEHLVLDIILEEYLSHPILQSIRALVLGCTHYPIIRNKIEKFYSGSVDVLDASVITAITLKEMLENHDLISSSGGHHRFYLSDNTPNFIQRARMFFGEDVPIEQMDIF